MGSSEDAFSDYGAILNPFILDQDEIMSDNVVNLFYTFHSNDHKSGDTMSRRVHYEIVLPSMKEVKGYVKFHVFDC